jgi:hypothetical protein
MVDGGRKKGALRDGRVRSESGAFHFDSFPFSLAFLVRNFNENAKGCISVSSDVDNPLRALIPHF